MVQYIKERDNPNANGSSRKTVVILNDTSGESHVGSSEVIKNLKLLCHSRGLDVLGTHARDAVKKTNEPLMEHMDKADLVIINGEGTLHHSPGVAAGLLNFVKGKKAVLINSVWDTMIIDDSKLFDDIKLVSLRESLSYNQIIKVIPDTKCRIVPDLIFMSDFEEDETKFEVGFTDSVMDYLRFTLNKRANYFPMQLEATHPKLKAFIRWMKSNELVVTGRFHGVCLAALCGVPFLAFPSNCHKIQGILRDMDCSDLLINSLDEINKRKQLAIEAKPKMNTYITRARRSIEQMFNDIRRIANE